MILAISRFRVANGREAGVARAFAARPRRVDREPGFLGIEIFTAAADPTVFHLVTRWTDVDSFRRWHASDAHHESHRGIPSGVKLDPAFTELVVLERLAASDPATLLEQVVADGAPMIADHLATSSLRVIRADREARILACSAAVARPLHRSPEQLAGRGVGELLVASDARALEVRLAAATRAGREPFLQNFVDANDSPFTLECRLDVQPDGFLLLGEPTRDTDAAFEQELVRLNNELAVASRENARKGRALERALGELRATQSLLVHREKMASLGQMTAGVAHEINNPLAYVANNHATLRRDLADLLGLVEIVGTWLPTLAESCPLAHESIVARAAEIDLEYLQQSVPRKLAANVEGLERIKQIVLDLRTFSRLDEAELKLCDPVLGIEAAVRFLGPLLHERGVSVTTAFGSREPIPCSPGALNQAIGNLIANAVQASREGQTICVSTAREDDEYVIEVADHGSGIAPEHLARVFDPFFTTKAVGEGTGLGMSIAHQIVTAHGGRIELQSRVDEGTTVHVRLPVHARAPEAGSGSTGGG